MLYFKVGNWHPVNWDGSGYPRHLKGKKIPQPARIFTVVDVLEALISDRPYGNAWTKEAAINLIKEKSGKYFAPDVVHVFLDVVGDQ